MMTLDELVLQKLAEWRPDSVSEILEIDHPVSGWKLTVAAERVDTLGCRLREVVLTRTTPLASQGSLADQAERIANRVAGLLEPLRLIEVDLEHHLAQLRSQQPSRRGGNVQYYELLRHSDGTTHLKRYEITTDTGAKRQAISFALTHEALAKVVFDLASA